MTIIVRQRMDVLSVRGLTMSRLPNTPQRQAPTSARNTMPKTMLFTPCPKKGMPSRAIVSRKAMLARRALA